MTTQSLKATTKAVKAPSKAVTVLSDATKLTLAPVALLFSNSYQFGIDHEKLVLAKGESETAAAHGFVNYVRDNKLNYQTMQAVKKHVVESIATAKKQAYDTIEKWFNKIVKAYLSNADLKGFVMPKAESKSAEGMAKARGELAKIADNELQGLIEGMAKAGDFKKAAQLSAEKKRRETVANNAVKKNESKATTELKTMLKKWVGSLDSTQLAALVYAKNNFGEIAKLAKATK
jgi:BMFP domain-containing protein YqiC